ncbi:hypothetical protein IFM89_035606 [Coptis chinensis]|uniref:ULTRAPETALA1/2 SAND domain-containing protein n=1 Tax=Coptis chinensis TaxID=261450 RepID=A0A835LG18_9MAGN|nr:hypothetical protein IFM89_035606 [Coptis chinensis]
MFGGHFMFSDEQLRDFDGFKRCEECVEVTCGCTSQCYGDGIRKLSAYPNGELFISCQCTPGCEEGLFTSFGVFDVGFVSFSWSDKKAYNETLLKLGGLFKKNFAVYLDYKIGKDNKLTEEITAAGPIF